MERIVEKAETMADQVEKATGSAETLQLGLDRQTQYIEKLKAQFEAFKEA
jgi:hypothetical protein